MLTLHMHPLSSFCHKVLMALYENGTPFESRLVDLMDAEKQAAFLALSPFGKMPVLRDEARDRTLPETSVIIEYLDLHYPGARPLIPRDPGRALETRLWDRYFDLYFQVPMQKIVADRLRPDNERDARGVADARAQLKMAYDILERSLGDRLWAAGAEFGLADCAALPGLFYAGILEPFAATHPRTAAYFERLLARQASARVLAEARPFFQYFPFRENIPARFLER